MKYDKDGHTVLESSDEIKLNFEWGWGRYDFLKKESYSDTYAYCSWVGVPLLGIPARDFQPFDEHTTEEQRQRWVEALAKEVEK
jgi:hypothetical protein